MARRVLCADGVWRRPGPDGKPLPPPSAPDCRHRGPPTGDSRPALDGPRGRNLPLLVCAVHGHCVETGRAAGTWSCLYCRDHEAPVAPSGWSPWPGLIDPYPDAPLDPLPVGWAARPTVRDRHAQALRAVVEAPLPPPRVEAPAGICYLAGGAYWPMCAVAVRMCREWTDLPIRIYHRGEGDPVIEEDVADLPSVTIHNLEALGRRRRPGAWEAKALAVRDCPWQRVVWLDADAYLVANPAAWAMPDDQHVAVAYWQDLPNHDWHLQSGAAGVPVNQLPPCVQGGQLMIDREAGWRMLNVAVWLNQHSEYYYTLGYGDQDMWRLALGATRAKVRCYGRAELRAGSFVCHHAGGPVVVHRCSQKLWGKADDPVAPDLPGEELLQRFAASSRRPIAPGTRDITESTGRANGAPDGARQLRGADVGVGEQPASIFGRIYASGAWTAPGSSGRGSDPDEAAPYVQLVRALAAIGSWHTVADLGCGDGRVAVSLALPALHGVDCVADLVRELASAHTGLQWSALDLDADRERLPAASVALVKDVLHHWPNALVTDWLSWAKRSRKWRGLLLTFDVNHASPERDCELGGYRPLSPALPPLADLGAVEVARYLHKVVCWLPC